MHLVEAARENGGITCAFIPEFDAKMRHFDFKGNVDGWSLYRHWPGVGSFACAFAIPAKLRRFIRSVNWQGRAGAIHLCLPARELYLVGVHLAHGSAFMDSVANVAHLLMAKPPKAEVSMSGDWNVNLLVAAPGLCSRSSIDGGETEKLDALIGLTEPFRLKLAIPTPSVSGAGGPFAVVAQAVPVSRLPEGKQCEAQKPSCLDFAFVPKHMASKPWLSWHMRPADHAFLHLVIPGAKPIIQYKPSTLRLLSWGQCLAWVERKSTSEHLEIESFMNFVRLSMNENADQRNRRQRRKERIPAHVQRLFEASEQALSEDARRHHRAQALLFLRRHYQVLRAEGARCLHGSGRLLRGSSNLHRIEKVILSSEASGSGKAGVVSTDREDWKCEMVHEFSIRWASGNLQKRGPNL